jgi:hypothetical protein
LADRPLTGPHPGRETAFGVGLNHLQARMSCKIGQTGEVSVDANDAVASLEEQASVTSAPAGNVEDLASVHGETGKADDPLGRIHPPIVPSHWGYVRAPPTGNPSDAREPSRLFYNWHGARFPRSSLRSVASTSQGDSSYRVAQIRRAANCVGGIGR